MYLPTFINLSKMFHPVVQESVTKAREISPERLEARRTAKSLDSEINRLKVKIATQQEQQGNREEVVRYVWLLWSIVIKQLLCSVV